MEPTQTSRGRVGVLRFFAVAAVVFGIMTVISGGRVLFGGEEARRLAGAYVGFVLVFNFMAGFAYVLAGAGLWRWRRWAVWLSIGIAVATVLVYGALGLHILAGGAFEMRTVWAMLLRSAVWVSIAILALRWMPVGKR